MFSNSLVVAESFLTDSRFGPEMVRRGAGALFDYYFALLRRLHERWNDDGLVSEPTKYFQDTLRIGQEVSAVLINRLNHQLAEEFGLVEFHPSRGCKPTVKLLDPQDLSSPYRYPTGRYFKVSLRLWDDPWAIKLSLKAKFLYMVALFENGINTVKEETGDKPARWFRSVKDMSAVYGIGTSTVSTALKELSVAGFLKVIPSDLKVTASGHLKRETNRYETVSLFSAFLHQGIQERRQREWGADRFAQVTGLARMLDAQNDWESVDLLADLLDLYPADEVAEVVASVAHKSRQNPRRTAKYVAGIFSHRHHDPVREVRLLGTVAAGVPVFAEEQVGEMVRVRVKSTAPQDVFALQVQGDSMVGAGIRNGNYLIVAPSQVAEDGQIVIALHNGESTVKRLLRRNGQVFLKPENPRYELIPVTSSDEFRIQGLIIGTSAFVQEGSDR